MLAKTISILISGKAGVGKTTLARLLVSKIACLPGKQHATILPFASALKEQAVLMGWDGKKDEKGRILLQKLGAVGREYDPDMWVKLSYGRMVDMCATIGIDYLITDDWRFPNELDCLYGYPSLQVFTVRIEAPSREILVGTPQYADVSETSLDGFKGFNYTLNNEGSIDELNINSVRVVEYILDHITVWK